MTSSQVGTRITGINWLLRWLCELMFSDTGFKPLALTRACFKEENEVDNLIARQYLGKVLEFSPPEHHLRAVVLTLRAISYNKRYSHANDVADLNLAIETYQLATEACPQVYLQHAHLLLQYALALQRRFTKLKDAGDLDLSINSSKQCWGCPGDLVITAWRSLALALDLRYRLRHGDKDLDDAIQFYALIVDLPSQDQVDPLFTRTGYAQALRMRFHRRGLVDDLNLAIHYFDLVVVIGCPPDDTSRSYLLGSLGFAPFLPPININYLAITLFTRYQLQGDKTDAHCARTYFQQALDLCPPGHIHHPDVLNNYACLLGRLSKEGISDPEDLELCIRYFYEALEHCYEPARSLILNHLALVLIFRFSRQGDPTDLDLASSLCQTALELRPEGHPHRPTTFLIQAKTVIERLTPKCTVVDIEIALGTLHAARETLPPGRPLLNEMYKELSSVYFLRHSVTKHSSDLEEAFKYRILATEKSSGGSRSQFEGAMKWVEDAKNFDHSSVLHAYKSAIHLLDLHLVLEPSVDLRHDIVKREALSLCAHATSCALRHQDTIDAVEMFEQSRDSGDLADRFENLSRQLDMPVTVGDDNQEAQRYRRVPREWNTVVDKIRAVNNFSNFLLPPSYNDLRAAAIGGPIIILNASRHSCDAIIVLAHGAPIHISFPENTFTNVLAMLSELRNLLCPLRWNNPNDEGGAKASERTLAGLLRRLWDTIVCDVVRGLEPHVSRNLRIWWCPTGQFTSLPLHAAAPWRKGEPGLSDISVSSYTPTLSALIRSRNKVHAFPGAPLSFVSIGQPNSYGYDELPTVLQELELVHELVPETIPFTTLCDETATCGAALSALSTHTSAHFACHGQQVPGQPFESHFAMHDGHLSPLDIIHSNLGPETEFAFLSACQTATGDSDAPDEVIHLAAALQFAGVRNVVGTTRSVEDSVVIHIVAAFYRGMIGGDGKFDPSRAARALRGAIKGTKDKVPLDQRIIFIHIGV
ncbi:hypothetical protein PAXRUDRAFT_35470 [Paxillus rubicundulus Ve08.2h10]|uniref:CHAT domain-containing protein n=1 Tax=Paxillus rubicundulus Ve08.2h10 TaxID=930991 RepID=A0A0D0DMQ8_9AGAM|nr:hypothetical protein PAXRUDRAFT_35470 [Paxillus rubicundulus Ve08.2h10]